MKGQVKALEADPIHQIIGNDVEDHHCATMNRYNYMMKNDPVYRTTRNQIDREAQTFVQKARKESAVGGIIVIPVVFHVISNPSVTPSVILRLWASKKDKVTPQNSLIINILTTKSA